ncbi:hypothetical protein [Limosilactobacillus mucosae]|uniref:Lipoprotein n=1 Tax=Limosilactobacillus mucosae TaxID=97478 RepID=A0AAJ1HPZ8_LIMMU|nr:hypothetical protein [Limosilactobacillus mucosae]MDC2826926.1 hypothetical protein [Limosilactobacillus mucosae]MDC2834625.1 hypothetical protein [Limosilactobacillus mucosae]
MKKSILVVMFLSMIFILSGCGSSSANNTADMKTMIETEADHVGYHHAKWPFFDEDWHFKKRSNGHYSSHGTFTTPDGEEHEFSAVIDPETLEFDDFYAN